jgi:excisionase family DNA binding protein
MAHTRSAGSHTTAGVELRLLTPTEVAKVLKCSEWWVKEQARKRRIPFTKTGGAYRFTTEHVHEIVRIFEERPGDRAEPEGNRDQRRRQVAQPVRPVVELRARRPRRARDTTA